MKKWINLQTNLEKNWIQLLCRTNLLRLKNCNSNKINNISKQLIKNLKINYQLIKKDKAQNLQIKMNLETNMNKNTLISQ